MRHASFVVIGGGPAGLSAARGYRAAGGDGRVLVLAREKRLPYRRPPLTKEYLRDELDAEELPLEQPHWFAENRVEVETGAPAVALDPEARVVTTETGEISFDRCVLATGAQPSRPDIPGAADRAVHTVARDARIELDGGRIACDPSGRTSADGVLAAGDAARLLNPTAARRISVEHWGEALAQGEVAGRTAAGAEASWDAVPGFWSTIGDRTVKQAAWGDGHDEVRIEEGAGGWSAWYVRDGGCVGVLTHERDEDYERGSELVAAGGRMP